MSEQTQTGAISIGPGVFLYQAMADMVKQSAFQASQMWELESKYAETVGGLDENGEMILGKDGKPTYGCYGAQLRTSLDAANDEKNALMDQAWGEISAGVVSGTACVAAGGMYLGSGSMFGQSQEAQNLGQFKEDFVKPKPGNTTIEAVQNDPGQFRPNLTADTDAIANNKTSLQEHVNRWAQKNRDSQPDTWMNNKYTRFITGRPSRVDALDVAQDEMQVYNAQSEYLATAHKTKVNENIDKLLETESHKNAQNVQAFSQKMTLLQMGQEGLSKSLQGYWTTVQANDKYNASENQAQAQIMQSSTQNLQGAENSYEQKANGYFQQSTQIAQEMAQIMRA